MCGRELRLLSIVEGDGFKVFCKELNPSFDVPCKNKVGKYLTLSFDQMKSDLIQSISCQPGVILTTDHWTCLATEDTLRSPATSLMQIGTSIIMCLPLKKQQRDALARTFLQFL